MSFIETQRLLIRKWMPSDVDAATAIYGDPEVMRFIPVGPLSREQTARMIERFVDEDERSGFGLWPVIAKETGAIVAECGLHTLAETGEVEIGWLFARDAWGKGYATEAGRAVLEFGFGEARLRRIVCLIDRENHRSVAVANRLQFHYDRIGRYYNRDLMKYYRES
ncbi:MAG TPA: GNAT family N-acetyltransferase [Candidatus Baltobacteraceae bacterium]|jgi:RimJ/RimL family protein N-acetyltransferase